MLRTYKYISCGYKENCCNFFSILFLKNLFQKSYRKSKWLCLFAPHFSSQDTWKNTLNKSQNHRWKPPKNCTILRVPNFNGTFQSRFRHIPVQLFFGQKSRSDQWKKIVKLLVVGIGIDERWRLKLTLEFLITIKNKRN